MSPVIALFAALVGAGPEVIDAPPAESEGASRCAPAIACLAKWDATDLVEVSAGSDGRGGDGLLVHAGQMVIKYDLGAGVEFDVYSNTLFLPGTSPRSAEGVQPGLKVSLRAETDWVPSMDVSVHLSLPTWNPDQTWDFEGWWYFSKTFGFLRADMNFMFAVADLRGAPAPQGMGTLTLNADLGRGVSLFGELFTTWGRPELPPGAGLFAGLSVAATDELVFDLGAEVAVHEGQQILTGFAGLTWVPQGHQRPQLASARLDAP